MKYRVMIVDDSMVVYSGMKRQLADSEFEIAGYCRSGEEALAQYESIKPDLVTMDIVMPGMDGLETSRELLERWPDAQVLVVSSLAYDETITIAKSVGAKGFLFKPFDKEALLDGLRQALGTASPAAAE